MKIFKLIKQTPNGLATFLCLFVLVCITFNVNAQSNRITGTVKDSGVGEALPGVSILIKGTTKGTTTDLNGNYSINADNGDILQFSFIGFQTKEVVVANQSVLNIALDTDLEQLEEVVVVGYGAVKKSDLTGSVASIKGSSFQNADPLSVQNALAGRVAGVQITQTDNAPGAGMRILIRGGSSLTGGNQPLYVIDGFPIVPDDSDPATNPLADISPSQIESIEVLKDASATAIYGAQGANGVVIITTKIGRKGKPKITASANFGVSEIANYPDALSPEEFARMKIRNIDEFQYTLGAPINSRQYWQDIIDNEEWGQNWMEEITRTAQTRNFDIGFSGGTENFKYAVSGNYLNQEGIIINSGFERMNLNTNLEQKVNDKIRIGTSLKLSTSKNTGLVNTWEESAIIKTALQSNPYIANEFSVEEGVDENDETFAWNNENITCYVNNVDNQFETSRMIGNIFFEYELIKGLKFYTSYGMNNYVKDGHNFLPKSTRFGNQIGGRVDARNIEQKRQVYQARLNYFKTFGKHQINATTVYETTKNESTNFFSRVEGFEDDSRGAFDYSSASTPFLPVNFAEENTLMSYLGRVNYTFGGKYLLTASLRADASSRFGTNNKWGYFPSVAVGWVASEEKFIENLNVFDLLKVRASYGVTGNNQIPSYSSLATLSTQRYVFNNTLYSGAVPASIANPDLRWETTDQYNIGFDMGFFDNRLMVNADFYYKKTTDLLLEVQLPLNSGFNTAI